MTTNDLTALLAADLSDRENRLVLADVLEECGRAEEAAIVRDGGEPIFYDREAGTIRLVRAVREWDNDLSAQGFAEEHPGARFVCIADGMVASCRLLGVAETLEEAVADYMSTYSGVESGETLTLSVSLWRGAEELESRVVEIEIPLTYRVVNGRYAQHPDPISGWDEFVEMCRAAFGDEFAEPRHREDESGVIWTIEEGGWERTLEPIRNEGE